MILKSHEGIEFTNNNHKTKYLATVWLKVYIYSYFKNDKYEFQLSTKQLIWIWSCDKLSENINL